MKELQVSGNTMSLEPGLYCVFNAPGSPVVAPETGLPGVRITVSPGKQAGRAELVGFHADGWVGPDSAVLVRVTGAGADVLVTVYQEKGTPHEAPKIQVMQLASASPTATAAPGEATAQGRQAPSEVETVAHIYARGDVGGRVGDWMGEPGSNRWIEGFGISPLNDVPPSDIEYQAVLGRGWLSPWSEGGQFCGSRGMSLPILGMRVRLRGRSAETHRVVLSASFVDGTRVGPVGGGEPCEAPSLAALEAYKVAFEPVASAKPAPKGKPAPAKAVPVEAAAPKAKPAKRAAKPAPVPTPAPAAAPKRRR